ncbi:suppressor of cytokine signaling 3-like [Heterodontus francisci]|uniref:suppressor of cytokine signaling 3-like n=1 Tax=Heterodontus francisci TaxID=7792 RepID=UPI00355AF7B5
MEAEGGNGEGGKTTEPDASYRFKAFAGDFGRVESALERLEASGFYWAALSGGEARSRLAGQRVGTFLLRDSSDPRHLFTLSVRTEAGITNLRVRQRRGPGAGGSFYLEAEGSSGPGGGGGGAVATATYNCVVRLVDHYVRLSGEAGKELCCRGDGGGQQLVPLVLRRPLLCKVPALQDLCRRALDLRLALGPRSRAQLETLPLPKGLIDTLGD